MAVRIPPDSAAGAAANPPDSPATPTQATGSLDAALPHRHQLPAATLAAFRDGDLDALGAVYDRYARPVWAVAVGVTRTDQLAQDAVQETFIRAWQAAASYDPGRDIGPWLLTIARYTALDVMRAELRPTRGGHEAEQDAVVDPPGIDQAWISWVVQEALGSLGAEEREIVRLSFFEDLTQVQISQRLGLPLGTVKSRSHRAHRRLAELLAHVRENPEPDTGEPRRPSGPYPDRETGRRRRDSR